MILKFQFPNGIRREIVQDWFYRPIPIHVVDFAFRLHNFVNYFLTVSVESVADKKPRYYGTIRSAEEPLLPIFNIILPEKQE